MSEENHNLSLKPFEIFIENEQKYIAYLLKQDCNDCVDFKDHFFINKNLKIIFNEIKTLVLEEVKPDIDLVYDRVKQKTHEIAIDDIKLIKDNYNDFENISIVKQRIKENYLKQVSIKNIFDGVLKQTTGSGDLDLQRISEYQDALSNVMLELKDEDFDLLTFEQLIKTKYLQLLHNRDTGVNKRTLGLRYLDKYLTYAGEPGDMITIAMRKGEGKTVLALNIMNALIAQEIPVVYFCLDMGYVTIMDRLLAIRGGVTSDELLQENKDDKLKTKINQLLEDLMKIQNFIVYPEGSISLNDFDNYVLKIRKMFEQNGSFKKDDKYFVVIFDTIDMVEDFSGTDAYKIKAGINKLATILKKYGIFSINLNQLNENQVRKKKPAKIEDVDFLKYTKEDIEGGSAYAARSRAVIIGTRPKAMKISFFPEETELLELEEDFMLLTIDKQNDGYTGRIHPKLVFDYHTMRLYEAG